MHNFSVEIPNEKAKTYKFFTFIILTLNFLGFGYVFLRTGGTVSALSLIALVFNAIPWLYYLLNKVHLKTPTVEITFILSALLWLYIGNVWMGCLLIAFGAIGFFVNKKLMVHFFEKGIEYPSFPPKKYDWQAVDNVLCKDGLLTIDLKNNTLIQINISTKSAPAFDEKGFNSFCQQCVASVNS